tara:strand:- start:11119 stop:12333 length:1215 start_codon:yes stop_codon:yes gene_type:complete
MKRLEKIYKLRKHPENPRVIKDVKFQLLVDSIKDFPEMLEKRPLVVNEDLQVLGGNMRLRAAQEAGLKEIWIDVAEGWSIEKQNEFIIKDNSGFGEWDWDKLANSWDVEDLNDWGLDLPPMFDEPEPEATEDDYTEPDNMQVDVVLGDLIEIGEHRLLCGDSTDSDQVAKLMNGEKAEIAFTSPPYNAGKTPSEIKNGKTSKYENDSDNKSDLEYLKLLCDSTNNSLLFSQYSFVNIQSLSGNKIPLINFLYNIKNLYADTIIWQKQTSQPAMAKNVLNSQFEYVHIFSKKANRVIGTKEFRGTIPNVLDISKQTQNKVKEHNATFPIHFAEFFVTNFCEKSILDLFLGSGTTMVAAHQLKRKCYGMELDPKYCQVIIDRMQKLDSKLEIKINNKIYEKTEYVL